MNLAGLRLGPDVSPGAPSQNRANVALLFLELAPNIGVSFLPLSTAVYLAGSLECGSWRDCAHTACVTLLPFLLLCGPEEQLPREEGGKMWTVCTSVLSLNSAASWRGFWEGSPFRGVGYCHTRSLKLVKMNAWVGRVGDRLRWQRGTLVAGGSGQWRETERTAKGRGFWDETFPCLPQTCGGWWCEERFVPPHVTSAGLRLSS